MVNGSNKGNDGGWQEWCDYGWGDDGGGQNDNREKTPMIVRALAWWL